MISGFYSAGMGYVENCLPKALVSLGHEVHLFTSWWNIYGTSKDYDQNYARFLGPANQGTQEFAIDGYIVHRLKSINVYGYVYMRGLLEMLKEIHPAVVHSTEIASLNSFAVASAKPFAKFKLFVETHQHLSVVKPYMKSGRGHLAERCIYRLTRTLPSFLAGLMIEKCYAISEDCAEVAHRLYGIPKKKIKLQSLGTDTDLFFPPLTEADAKKRGEARAALGYEENDIICLYTGRFSEDKNPLALAKAVENLSIGTNKYKGLFIGDGSQRTSIASCKNTAIRPFMRHTELADVYRLADIAIWPRQESMSMLDAAASGLPIIVSARAGVQERVTNNGLIYDEDNVEDLARVIASLESKHDRLRLGSKGREKAVELFSWRSIAASIVDDYRASGIA
jgi:glycosyltransferase involved in cell wall biosynthesis